MRYCQILAQIAAPVAILAIPMAAHAATGGGGGLPWDAPLQTLQTDLTGSTATALSLIGIVAVFGVLIFGGELNHFFRSLCYIILLVSVLVAGQNILSDLGITGAVTSGAILWFSYALLVGVAAGALWLSYRLGVWHGHRKAMHAAQAIVLASK